MNLNPPLSDPGGPPAPPDWTMHVGVEGQGEAAFYYADLHREGVKVCRIVLTGSSMSDDAARRLLTVKARTWIDDYLSRPHTGTTRFDPLM